MSKQNDGGPAFPCEIGFGCQDDNMHQTGGTVAAWYGMSLRDACAIAAMQGICAHPDTWGLGRPEIAIKAYALADDMLEARKA